MNAANKQKLHVSTKQDDAFIARGYKNWKRGTTGFKTHKSSECHREAIEVLSCEGNVQILERNYSLTILRKNPNIGKFS